MIYQGLMTRGRKDDCQVWGFVIRSSMEQEI